VDEETSLVFSEKSLHGLPYELKSGNSNLMDMIDLMKKHDRGDSSSGAS
jgi:hypothetical protein